ncbi:MAG: YkgJ family cysteine cluster protein [Desulfobulbaceae bacterium]|jgi:Fe-S-cluster containining protein|nr:YkgJ family cysteine cluster protein [Desulfobulbaceae bacterium]
MEHTDNGPLQFGKSNNPSNVLPMKLTLDSKIRFRCHPGVSCFTACCGDINIILTPYDILQLSRRLQMPPHEFISQYAAPTFLEQTDMPGVRIKMRADDNRCPFVTPRGCTVYSDRPTACRYYPIGMADFHEGGRKEEDGKEVLGGYDKFYFKVLEEHCKGHLEDKEWTIVEWRADQGVDVRDEMNKEWLRLIMRRKSHGHQASLSEQAQRMFFMASTDMPSFRRFIFESSFLDTYEIEPELVEKIRNDDVELMKFSFFYLAATLFGAQGLKIKEEKIQAKVAAIKQRQDESVLEAIREYEEMKKTLGEAEK